MSELAKGNLHSILKVEVSQLPKPRVSDFGTIELQYPQMIHKFTYESEFEICMQ